MIEISEDRAKPEAGEPIVRLRDVVKTYNDDGLMVTAVGGITLDILPRRFSMIVGPSGSGKTTLLNLYRMYRHTNLGQHRNPQSNRRAPGRQ